MRATEAVLDGSAVKPKMPATTAISKKIKVQRSIVFKMFYKDRVFVSMRPATPF